jgi:ubiquinone/menaquinone biosynthesis C-methylase UbiE
MSTPPPTDPKAHSQARFSQFAQGYVEAAVFKSDELNRLVELAAPQPSWMALDIATGGGHTALKFAPLVGHVVAVDYAPAMLEAARGYVSKNVANVSYSGADAENMPFVSESFDLITCRVAAHHFPDPFKFMGEVARCLKPGGVFILQDLITPDDERAARYVDSFERLRDPSHVRMLAIYEWEGLCLDTELTVEAAEVYRKPANMLDWAQRQGCDAATIQHLHVLMAQAPAPVRDWLNICCVGSDDAGFDHVYVLLRAVK